MRGERIASLAVNEDDPIEVTRRQMDITVEPSATIRDLKNKKAQKVDLQDQPLAIKGGKRKVTTAKSSAPLISLIQDKGGDVYRITQGSISVDIKAAEAEEFSLFPDAIFTMINKRQFCTLLKNSLSLSVEEKARVIFHIPSLSQFQVDELIKIFIEEVIQFGTLKESHGEDLRDLMASKLHEWPRVLTQLRAELIEDLRSSVHTKDGAVEE